MRGGEAALRLRALVDRLVAFRARLQLKNSFLIFSKSKHRIAGRVGRLRGKALARPHRRSSLKKLSFFSFSNHFVVGSTFGEFRDDGALVLHEFLLFLLTPIYADAQDKESLPLSLPYPGALLTTAMATQRM